MLSTKEGVKTIKVNLEAKEGYVEFFPSKVSPEDIAEQVEDMGFEAYVKSINGKNIKKGKYCRILKDSLLATADFYFRSQTYCKRFDEQTDCVI